MFSSVGPFLSSPDHGLMNLPAKQPFRRRLPLLPSSPSTLPPAGCSINIVKPPNYVHGPASLPPTPKNSFFFLFLTKSTKIPVWPGKIHLCLSFQVYPLFPLDRANFQGFCASLNGCVLTRSFYYSSCNHQTPCQTVLSFPLQRPPPSTFLSPREEDLYTFFGSRFFRP